ncbi:4244_t:CDS:2, partial [Diversispora eburnea]
SDTSSTTHGSHFSTEATNRILNESQSEIILSVNITDPEGVILKKIHQALECNQEDSSFINDFIHTSMELEKHSKDPREKLSRDAVKALHLSTTSQIILDLLDIAEYKESKFQVELSSNYS